MTEEFLHYIWQFGQYDHQNLTTEQGERISVFNTGFLNEDAGPDFFSAKIQIGKALWVGNVEVHLKSSDWYRHKHQFNNAYNNVILHVVYEHDREVFDPNGEPIPTLQLKKIVDENLFVQYQNLIQRKKLIPCEHLISKVDHFTISHWLDNLGVQRLLRKSAMVEELIKRNNGDLEETFFQLLAKSFGFKINAQPFEMLARQISFKHLLRLRNSQLQMEALMFGAGGFLEENFDELYPNVLKREYKILKKKFNLHTLPKSIWKFHLLRPGNFPTIRIAQLAALLKREDITVGNMLEINSVQELTDKLRVLPSEYWNNHYILGKKHSKNNNKALGVNAVRNIIINCVVPFIFAYGKLRHREDLKEKALVLLEEIPAENNKIIKMWDLLGIRVLNAFRSQALIELKNQFCFEKKCLNCNIGKFILKNKIGDTKYSRFL